MWERKYSFLLIKQWMNVFGFACNDNWLFISVTSDICLWSQIHMYSTPFVYIVINEMLTMTFDYSFIWQMRYLLVLKHVWKTVNIKCQKITMNWLKKYIPRNFVLPTWFYDFQFLLWFQEFFSVVIKATVYKRKTFA